MDHYLGGAGIIAGPDFQDGKGIEQKRHMIDF
jgi:hypothetical protein